MRLRIQTFEVDLILRLEVLFEVLLENLFREINCLFYLGNVYLVFFLQKIHKHFCSYGCSFFKYEIMILVSGNVIGCVCVWGGSQRTTYLHIIFAPRPPPTKTTPYTIQKEKMKICHPTYDTMLLFCTTPPPPFYSRL